jgi:hypothetical protein
MGRLIDVAVQQKDAVAADYAFPTYRRGVVYTPDQEISVDQARRAVERIKANAGLYESAFRNARPGSNGDRPHSFQTNAKEKIHQQREESYIVNFPGIAFRLYEYLIQSRVSVTVCMNEHRSKLWLRLSCARINGREARGLTAHEVRRFFQVAAKQAGPMLSAVAALYRQQAQQEGITVPDSEQYTFQLRAYDSSNPSAAELCQKIRQGLSLSKALKIKAYRRELLDYFHTACERKVTPAEVIDAVTSGSLDVFGYKSPSHDALFSARTAPDRTDLCGYGYDPKPLGTGNLVNASTRDLLKEYAQQF